MPPSIRSASPFDDLDDLFRDLNAAHGIVLAISGGPDSTALMHLAARWRESSTRRPIWVASVDHGLRAGSADEAARVAATALTLGLGSQALVWDGQKPLRAIQEKARTARYALLVSFAKGVGATHLATAHTLDDQAETLLFRMARGSSLAGLGGMRPVADREGINHVRPFLALRKQRLVDLCVHNHWPFTLDPANSNTAFARTRWRFLSPALAAEGLTPERLGTLAERLARAELALNHFVAQASAACMTQGQPECHCYRGDALMRYPVEVISRLIGTTLIEVGNDDRLRLNRLEDLVASLIANHGRKTAMRRTLHHCLIVLDAQGMLTISREGARRRGVRAEDAVRLP